MTDVSRLRAVSGTSGVNVQVSNSALVTRENRLAVFADGLMAPLFAYYGVQLLAGPGSRVSGRPEYAGAGRDGGGEQDDEYEGHGQ